jgi:hypothetical protein
MNAFWSINVALTHTLHYGLTMQHMLCRETVYEDESLYGLWFYFFSTVYVTQNKEKREQAVLKDSVLEGTKCYTLLVISN